MRITKSLVFKSIICLMLIFGADRFVGVIMNYSLNNLKNGNVYELKYKLLQAKPSIVILGSSRANRHYNATQIEKAFGQKTINYGQDGSDVFLHYIMLKTLLRSARPQMIILDIKPGEFDAAPNFNQASTLYPIIDKVAISDEELAHISPYEKIKLMLYAYRFNNQVVEMLSATRGPKTDTAAISGFLPLPAKHTVLQKVNVSNNNLDTGILKYLHSIIELCKSHNIKLVICTSPYYNNIVHDRSLAEAEKICKQTGIPYINYTNNALLILESDAYNDEAHLNAGGADVFTRDVIKRVQQLK